MADGVDWNKWRAKVARGATQAAKTLGKAQGFASIAVQAAAKPGPLSMLGLGISALHMAGDLLKSEGGERVKGWHKVSLPRGAGPFAWSMIGENPVERDGSWCLNRLGDQMVGAYTSRTSTSNGSFSSYFFRAERDPEDVKRRVVEHILGQVGQHSAMMSADWGANLVAVEAPHAVPSERADAIWRRLAPVIAAGHTRAILLDGPPGIGKSTIARTLARRVCDAYPGATTMRIAVSDLADLHPGTVDGMLDLLRSDVLVLDDLDRCDKGEAVFDLFEHCHGRQRLVIVTTNTASALPGALRRPGRIDEVIRIEGVGAELARTILGPAALRMTEEQIRAAAGWPAEHVSELALRLSTIPGADAAEEVADVGARARANAA